MIESRRRRRRPRRRRLLIRVDRDQGVLRRRRGMVVLVVPMVPVVGIK
jgi:hypothetical protein